MLQIAIIEDEADLAQQTKKLMLFAILMSKDSKAISRCLTMAWILLITTNLYGILSNTRSRSR